MQGAFGPTRLQTRATFNYLLVNCPPDTCKNKTSVRGAGAGSLPGPHPGVPGSEGPPAPSGVRPGRGCRRSDGPGRAGPSRGGRIRPSRGGRIRPSRCGPGGATGAIPRAQRALSLRTYRDIFQRIRGDHALVFSLRGPIRLSVPVPPHLYFSCFYRGTPLPNPPPFPAR